VCTVNDVRYGGNKTKTRPKRRRWIILESNHLRDRNVDQCSEVARRRTGSPLARNASNVDGVQLFPQLEHGRSSSRILTPSVLDELPHVVGHGAKTTFGSWPKWSLAIDDLKSDREAILAVKRVTTSEQLDVS
jgi:hypothetical protein